MISCDAQGIFLIENEDTFEQVCKIPEIADTWLCIWGKGYATDGLAEFLRGLDGLPVAAWGDLDAHGIRIIGNLADRIGRPVTPVAMTVDLYRASTKYHQEPAKLEETQARRPARGPGHRGPARSGRRDRSKRRARLRTGDPLRRCPPHTPGPAESRADGARQLLTSRQAGRAGWWGLPSTPPGPPPPGAAMPAATGGLSCAVSVARSEDGRHPSSRDKDAGGPGQVESGRRPTCARRWRASATITVGEHAIPGRVARQAVVGAGAGQQRARPGRDRIQRAAPMADPVELDDAAVAGDVEIAGSSAGRPGRPG